MLACDKIERRDCPARIRCFSLDMQWCAVLSVQSCAEAVWIDALVVEIVLPRCAE